MNSMLRKRLARELEELSHELMRTTGASPRPRGPEGRGRSGPTEALQSRIRLLGKLMAGLASVDASTVAFDRVGFGSTVRVRDRTSGAEDEYTLLPADVMEVEEGQVSLESPIGNALLGRRTGEQVTVATPRGQRSLEIVSVLTLPQSLGLAAGDRRDASATEGDLLVADGRRT